MSVCYNFSFHNESIRISKRSDGSVVIINCGEQFIFSKADVIEIVDDLNLKPITEDDWSSFCYELATTYCG